MINNTLYQRLGMFLQVLPLGALMGVIAYLVAQRTGYVIMLCAAAVALLISTSVYFGVRMQMRKE